jgi:protein-S-isoprenylcysteine O-methyltransferase Ste14
MRHKAGGEVTEVAAAEFTRWFLALFFVGVAAFYTIRIIVAKHRMHSSPVFSGEPGTLHWATHTVFRVFRVLILGVCLARLAWPDLDRYLVPFDTLWRPVVLILGCSLLGASFLAVILIHFYMGEDWRSGTRVEDEPHLITTGPFSLSRNPMMLFVIAAQFGLFLALPSLFTLVCLVLGVWAVTAQVGVEERLLRRRFGEDYDSYASHTPRWLGYRRSSMSDYE